MLSRVAGQLHWMARYCERAENMARMLDVAERMVLIPQPAAARESAWRSVLEVAGAGGGDAPSREEALRRLALDAASPASIVSSLSAMRENARALRSTITVEMFETVNATWLELERRGEGALAEPRRFFDWVKERCHLFRGVTAGTLLRDEAMLFMQAGFDLERADATARLLDSKYHVLLPSGDEVGGALDHYQWGAILRSLSAFRAYHGTYRGGIAAFRVAELVILDPRLPRSLRACYDRLVATFEELGNAAETRRLAGRRHASLAYARMEQIFESGLHEFLEGFVADNAAVGERFARDFMMTR